MRRSAGGRRKVGGRQVSSLSRILRFEHMKGTGTATVGVTPIESVSSRPVLLPTIESKWQFGIAEGVQLITAVVVAYFTRELVRIERARDRRETEDKIKRAVKNLMRRKSGVDLQEKAAEGFHKFHFSKELFIELVEELREEDPMWGYPTAEQQIEFVKDLGVTLK